MGLLRTAARAAVATRVVGSVHRRQQQQWAAQDAMAQQAAQAAQPVAPAPVAAAAPAPEPVAPVPPAPAASTPAPSLLDQLTQLGALRDSGVLTEQEFAAQKQRILAGG
ncbi:SHOCT domain-containing protein [Microbacterium sp. No. 7]|uniref:SHOCT domain-containing protein n=1 Tax=Microbacterium sp. No. 7 TaxID=1714373 RepID=UPI0006D04F72|nr:SHOCT domain-containing protein [Microbacterium sp. No. 7]ALJ20308.1 hypothetical protein AOA12_10445 [Microbacterium sp. No. 7]